MAKANLITNLTIPAIWASKKLNDNILKVSKHFNDKGMLELFQSTAIQCLLHAQKYGDVGFCQRLYDGVGGSISAINGEGLKIWFGAVAPITARRDPKTGLVTWGLKDGWKAEDFDMQSAVNKPFWEYVGIPQYPAFGAENIMTLLNGLSRRIDNAVEKGTFKGDVKKTKELVSDVIAVAATRLKGMSPKERGEEDKTNDVILEAAKQSRVAKAPEATA